MRNPTPHIAATFIGIVEILVGSLLIGQGSGYQILMLSIICTAGISLVVWLPLAWLFGTLTISVLRLPPTPEISSVEAARPPAIPRQAVSARTRLDPYVAQKRAEGDTVDALRKRLRKAGWDEATVEEALQQGVGEGQGVAKL